jgi:hypothetical protein
MKEFDFSTGNSKTTVYKNTCYHCKEDNVITIDEEPFMKWYNREMYAQDAFRGLGADKTEIIISGTHTECWNAMFPGHES